MPDQVNPYANMPPGPPAPDYMSNINVWSPPPMNPPMVSQPGPSGLTAAQSPQGGAMNMAGVGSSAPPDPSGNKGNSGSMTGLMIGAGLGLLSSIGQQSAYQAQAKAAATQTRYSPWTHMGAGQLPAVPNSLGQVAGLAAAGATLGQGVSGGSLMPMAMTMGQPRYYPGY